jgi:hypothetical protein
MMLIEQSLVNQSRNMEAYMRSNVTSARRINMSKTSTTRVAMSKGAGWTIRGARWSFDTTASTEAGVHGSTKVSLLPKQMIDSTRDVLS